MTDVIKVQFIRNGQPCGAEYTYRTPEPVKIGDKVDICITKGIVTRVYVPETEFERFGGRGKTILGKSIKQ